MAKKVKVKGQRTGLQKFNKFLFVVFIILLIATILIVTLSSAKGTIVETAETEFVDEPKIEAFQPGTYGGIEFKTVDDVVNYYVKCYDYTKTLTAEYVENGENKTYYKLLGDENLVVENLLVEGKPNGTIDSLVPTILGGIFKGSVRGLSPAENRDPIYDNKEDGAIDYRTSHLLAEDVLACNVTDNKDGTITLVIQPKAQILAMPNADSQGRFFNVLGDITSTVESISLLSFSSGTVNDNFVVNYAGGTGTIKINVADNEIVEADYEMLVHIDVKHANITVFKDKNASLDIVYTNHFPATGDYLLKSRNITRK